MQTYKAFMKIAKKNLPSMAIYFIIFMVLSVMMSSQSSDNQEMMYKDEEISFTVFNRKSDIVPNLEEDIKENNK